MENKKIALSFTVDEGSDDARTMIAGNPLDLCVAYIELSKELLGQFEEKYGEGFTRSMYASCQQAVIDGSCLKKSYDEHVKQFKKVEPLMNILGKTFKKPEKEEA